MKTKTTENRRQQMERNMGEIRNDLGAQKNEWEKHKESTNRSVVASLS